MEVSGYGFTVFIGLLTVKVIQTSNVDVQPSPIATVRDGSVLWLSCTFDLDGGTLGQIVWKGNDGGNAATVTPTSSPPCATLFPDAYTPDCSQLSSNEVRLEILNPVHRDTYSCTVYLSNYTLIGNISTQVAVVVPVPSVTFTLPISDTVTVTPGGNQTYTCVSGSCRPPARIDWYKDGMNVTTQTGSVRGDGNKFVTTSSYTLTAAKGDSPATVHCRASNVDGINPVVSGVKNFIVQWLPDGPPVISGYTSSSILYINDTLSLSCRQTGGNPLSTLTWTGVCGGISATDGSTGTESVSTIIIIVTKSYNQGTCGCVSTHPQPQGQNRSQVTFTVHYAPTKDPVLTGYTEGQILYEGSPDLSLTCIQEGGNPLSTITWNCEGHTGRPGTGSSTEVTSNVQVPPNRSINRKSCTCTSRSPDTNITFEKSKTVVFTVYYAPLSAQLPSITGYTSDEVLYEGDPTRAIQCHQAGGFPLATLTWDCFGLSGINMSTQSESVSTIQLSTNRDYNGRNCTCTASHPDTNVTYRRSDYVTVTVHYAPTKEPVLTGYIEGQILYEGSPDLSLTCTQEGGNPLSTITWDCEGQTGTPGTGSSTEVTSTVQVPRDRNINRKSCTCTSRSPDTNITFQKSTTVVFTIYYSPLSTQLPSISGYTSGEVLYEGDPVRSIQCHQAGGFPLATLTWDCFGLSGNNMSTQSASVSTIQLSTNRDYNDRNCTCTASHPDINVIYRRSDYVTVTVHYPPSSPTVSQTPTHPWLEGESGTLNCSYTEGFPALTRVEWFRNGRLQTGQSSPSITLTSLTKDYNQAGYGCRVKNDFTDVKLTNLTSSVIYLNVEFRPLVTLTPTTLTVVEGQTAEVTCDTEGNPTPRVEWLRGGASVQTGQGTSLTLTLGDVDRSETDNYTCRAEGVSSVQGRQLITQRITPIVVQYPPNITVSVPQTVWEGHANVSLRCQTVGEPNVLTSLSWTQTIGKTVIGNEFGANKDTLILTEVTFDDTGTYTCSASNDVPNRQGNTVQSNSALFNVKVSPKFNTSGQNYIFYRRLHEPVNITIPFYSNPPVSSKDDIEWTITTQAAPINATFNLNNHSSIDLTIKGTTVVFSGQAVVMFLDNFDQSLAGDHNITVYNDRSRRPSITTFSLNPSGPPDKSYDFKAIGATSTSITVQWTKGFNGGHTQTFVVLFGTEANGLHQNISIREEHYLTYTYEIMNLIPNTRYELNMYSYNEEGNSSFYSQNIVKRTMEEAMESPGNLAAIAGGAGGSVAALLIIIPIVIIVLYRRRKNGKQTDSHTRSNVALVEEPDDVEEDGIKMNVLYESAGPYLANDHNDGVEAGATANIGSNDGDHMYAEVKKKKKMPAAAYAEVIPKKDRKGKVEEPEAGSGDLYAQVQKKEKEKKEKGKEKKKKVEKGKGKKKQKLMAADFNADTVYENVGAVGGKSDEMYGNTNAEIEQQKANIARKKNKDGLIYLDLEFKDQQNGTRQVVIHGIENRNDYAIVDFTKKADPLPDSDPEENELSKPADNK